MQWDWKSGIQNDAELETALGRVHQVFDAEEGSAEAAERDRLVALIESYEDAHYPISLPSRDAAIAFRREQEGRA